MKLPLKHFLILSILVGCVGLPLGFKYIQARREAEILRLEKELTELRDQQIDAAMEAFVNYLTGETQTPDEKVLEHRIKVIEARLEKLTSKKTRSREKPARRKANTIEVFRFPGRREPQASKSPLWRSET